MGYKLTVIFPDKYKEKLKIGAEKLGISKAEFLRRAIDEYLARNGLPTVLDEPKDKP